MFIKFPKIENIDLTKDCGKITGAVRVMEKIDGSNIGIYLEPGKEPEFWSRNGHPFKAYGFENYKKVFCERIQAMKNRINEPVYFHGEYFGKGILNRINYGERNRIVIYAQYDFYGKALLDPQLVDTYWCFKFPELSDLFILNIWSSKDASSLPDVCHVPYKSAYSLSDNREGYVIYEVEGGFVKNLYKVKDPKFADKKSCSGQQIDPEIKAMHEAFLGYLTKNRMLDTLSKFGGKGEAKVILSAFIKDAKEDFAKDFDVLGLSKEQAKVVLNGGSTPYQLYKQCMDEIKEGE